MARKAPALLMTPNRLDRQVECVGARTPEGLAI